VSPSLEDRLAAEARTEYEPTLPSDHRTPLDEQLDRFVFEQVVANRPQFTFADIIGDKDKGSDPFAHARAYQARCLHPEIGSDPGLHRFLSRFEDELDRLGFTDGDGNPVLPSREAFRRFRTERVDPDWLDQCGYLTVKVREEIGQRFGYESIKNASARHIKDDDRVAKDEIRSAYERLVPHLDEHLEDGRDRDKITHPWSAFKDVLGNASGMKTSCSDALREMQRPEHQQDKVLVEPHHDNSPGEMSVKGFFEGLAANSATKYMKCFEHIFREFLKKAERNGMFGRPVDLMIDGTKFVYNPKVWNDGKPELPEGTVGTGSNEYSYRFITVSVYDREHQKTLKPISFPMRERSQLFTAVAYIIRMLQDFMNIREVFADSEFATGPILNFLAKRNIDYTFRFSKAGDEIKSWLRGMSGNSIAGAMDYTINQSKDESSNKHHETRLLAKRVKRGKPDMSLPKGQHSLGSFVSESGQLGLDDFDRRDIEEYDGPWFVYATSHDVPDDRESVRSKLREYASRWNVETDYRVVKQNFMPFTNTDKYAIRVLFWFWAVALYNAWVLADMLIKMDRGQDFEDDYSVRSKPFRREIAKVEYG